MDRKKISILCVDFQNDFCDMDGRWYKERDCHNFIKDTLPCFLRKYNLNKSKEQQIKIAVINSDYRLPRPSENEEYCVPGTKGYQSGLPNDVTYSVKPWIKCMNSPLWVRENAGDPSKPAGKPYIDGHAFNNWLSSTIGFPSKNHKVFLIGVTLDCCVLATAMELYHLGYAHNVQFLFEGVDSYEGTQKEKEQLLNMPMYKTMWANGSISWEHLREQIKQLET